MISASMELSAAISTEVISGVYYRFRYRALNEVGFGPYSDFGYILTASVPDKPLVLTIEPISDFLMLKWQMPYNRASLVTIAEIKLLGKDMQLHHELANCDGSLKEVFDARSCSIPSSVLRLAPFSFVQGDLIKPVIRFRNQIGWS